jgi:electron transport complex protein RnfG
VRDVLKLGLVLMVICAISGGLLAYVHGVTSEIIDERKAQEVAEAMRVVLPSAESFESLDDEELASIKADPRFAGVDEVFEGVADGSPVGVVAKVQAPGYGGKISLLVGMDSELIVTGLQVLGHSETPGLGANIAKMEFTSQFVGKGGARSLAVDKDGGEISSISGATISSRGMVTGVNLVRDLVSALGIAGGVGR